MSATSRTRRRSCGSATSCSSSTPAITSTWSSATRASSAARGFVNGSRQEWERTFAINWWGTYFCARAFLPLLIASGDGILVKFSSVAGFWATAGPGTPPITAYSTSNFAIKGFSEALIEDLRPDAPQVRVVVVMPGLVNTGIAENSRRALGLQEWEQLSDAELMDQIPEIGRAMLLGMGLLTEGFSADDLRQAIPRLKSEFQGKGIVPPGPRRRPSSWTGCDTERGGSSSARTPRCSTSRCARTLRPPLTTTATRRCSAPW